MNIPEKIEVRRVEISGLHDRKDSAVGLIALNSLPFIFRVEKMPSRVRNNQTEWSFLHKPYNPLGFQAPFATTVGTTPTDQVYMLKTLGLSQELVYRARCGNSLPDLLKRALERRTELYDRFFEIDYHDPGLKADYKEAVFSSLV